MYRNVDFAANATPYSHIYLIYSGLGLYIKGRLTPIRLIVP
jgi:hypothetical protein